MNQNKNNSNRLPVNQYIRTAIESLYKQLKSKGADENKVEKIPQIVKKIISQVHFKQYKKIAVFQNFDQLQRQQQQSNKKYTQQYDRLVLSELKLKRENQEARRFKQEINILVKDYQNVKNVQIEKNKVLNEKIKDLMKQLEQRKVQLNVNIRDEQKDKNNKQKNDLQRQIDVIMIQKQNVWNERYKRIENENKNLKKKIDQVQGQRLGLRQLIKDLQNKLNRLQSEQKQRIQRKESEFMIEIQRLKKEYKEQKDRYENLQNISRVEINRLTDKLEILKSQ